MPHLYTSLYIYARGGAREPGYTARLVEERKLRDYKDVIESKLCAFVPLASETYGRWGRHTVRFLKNLAAAVMTRVGREGDKRFESRLLIRWWALLGIALQKGNAIVISEKTADRARASFQVGEVLIGRGV